MNIRAAIHRARTITIAHVAALLTSGLLADEPNQYTVPWLDVGGGGGISTGAGFSLRSVIGRVDVGRFSGEGYGVAGGLWWAFPIAPTSEVPRLKIRRSGPAEIALSWPATATGFQLEESFDLEGWFQTDASPIRIKGENRVFLGTSADRRFYRLRKP